MAQWQLGYRQVVEVHTLAGVLQIDADECAVVVEVQHHAVLDFIRFDGRTVSQMNVERETVAWS